MSPCTFGANFCKQQVSVISTDLREVFVSSNPQVEGFAEDDKRVFYL